MISTIVAMFALCHAGDTPVSDDGPLQFNNRADLDVDIKTFLFDMRRSSDDFLSDNGETATTAKAKVFKWAKRFLWSSGAGRKGSKRHQKGPQVSKALPVVLR